MLSQSYDLFNGQINCYMEIYTFDLSLNMSYIIIYIIIVSLIDIFGKYLFYIIIIINFEIILLLLLLFIYLFIYFYCYYYYYYFTNRKEMFYLTTHSTHFIYGYMASDIW